LILRPASDNAHFMRPVIVNIGSPICGIYVAWCNLRKEWETEFHKVNRI